METLENVFENLHIQNQIKKTGVLICNLRSVLAIMVAFFFSLMNSTYFSTKVANQNLVYKREENRQEYI